MRTNFTYNEIKEAQDFLIEHWGEDGEKVIAAAFNLGEDELIVRGMPMSEFLQSCTACGGNWGGMLLSGLKKLAPSVWAVIPDNMGVYAWAGICYTLMLCGINTKEEG